MSKSQEFEKLISRIYKLISGDKAEVTWNETIPDPDNESQQRQIDVLIKREGVVAHVECRTHNKPQDVKWIEELIGRKISLGADFIIAVSDSGFTQGAVKKAQRYEIVLRNLSELNDEEIKAWGRKSKVTLTFYGFLNIGIRLLFKNHSDLNLKEIAEDLHSKSEFIDSLFNTIKYELNKQKDINYPCSIFWTTQAHNMELCGKKLEGITIRAEVHTFEENLEIPTVSIYGDYNPSSFDAISTMVEKNLDIELEVIKSNTEVSVILNLSNLPQDWGNSVLAGIIKWNFGQPVNLKVENIHMYGTQEQKMYLVGAEVGLQEFGT
ncbi:MAG: restriction endonuclease [Proteobacteria bacterium]|nr:restriction endonuclease [Desulfocapsa sp.]MBU3945017.1 restriction endonuclease [Pseudomonadota bacterium]MCG2742416.1 restriction endonuclease [Desulfobacteraceae bacterium]MBU4030502.1 restriction endonuclease [Pseudomonadota bacterium]MBU4042272.1 restriction endonuclease [Pseudomonadota bacterium]